MQAAFRYEGAVWQWQAEGMGLIYVGLLVLSEVLFSAPNTGAFIIKKQVQFWKQRPACGRVFEL